MSPPPPTIKPVMVSGEVYKYFIVNRIFPL
jgi:hypothetical protein